MEYALLGYVVLIGLLILAVVVKKRRHAKSGNKRLKLVQEPRFKMEHAEVAASRSDTKRLKVLRSSVSKRSGNKQKVSNKKK